MSDQTPPTDAPPAGGYPPPPPMPVAPPVTPYPTAPYANPQYPTAPYPNPQYPTAPAANLGYAPAGYYANTSSAPAVKKPGGLGLVALLLALAAAVVAPIMGAVAAFQVGVGTGARLETMNESDWVDLSFLSHVREWVLLGEIAFWAGTVLGIWAIVQGIVAIVKRRGLGTGIAAVVVAVVALFIFSTLVYGAGIAGVVASYDLGV